MPLPEEVQAPEPVDTGPSPEQLALEAKINELNENIRTNPAINKAKKATLLREIDQLTAQLEAMKAKNAGNGGQA